MTARANGTKFGRPPEIGDTERIANANHMQADGPTAKYLDVSGATLYRYLATTDRRAGREAGEPVVTARLSLPKACRPAIAVGYRISVIRLPELSVAWVDTNGGDLVGRSAIQVGVSGVAGVLESFQPG